jgi:predicted DNA-binding transcriptional regulator AlpA
MSLEHAPQRAGIGHNSGVLEPLLTVQEVSKLIGRSVTTLEKDRLYGTGPEYLKLGRLVRYRPSAVQAWLAERARRSTSDTGGETPI